MKSIFGIGFLTLSCALLLALVAASNVKAAENQFPDLATNSTPSAALAKGATDKAADAQTRGQEGTSKLRGVSLAAGPGTPLLSSKSGTPPPPVTTGPDVTLPAFPYQYVGRIDREGLPTSIYLTKDQQIFLAGVGDTIEGTYRVNEVTADHMELTYLPLGKNQTVTFSSIAPPSHGDATTAVENPLASSPPAPETPQPLATVRSGETAAETASATPHASGPPVPILVETGQTGAGASARGAGYPGAQTQPGTVETSSPGVSSMPISSPTVSQMPTSPPSVSQMPTSPPSVSRMPILPPAGSMQISPSTTQ